MTISLTCCLVAFITVAYSFRRASSWLAAPACNCTAPLVGGPDSFLSFCPSCAQLASNFSVHSAIKRSQVTFRCASTSFFVSRVFSWMVTFLFTREDKSTHFSTKVKLASYGAMLSRRVSRCRTRNRFASSLGNSIFSLLRWPEMMSEHLTSRSVQTPIASCAKPSNTPFSTALCIVLRSSRVLFSVGKCASFSRATVVSPTVRR
mmetsp:Transcript_116249/g.202142  ORF Transcript_116249/g.202142 Transcript_116249/m.202142 type:complete len:205 (+) Transcript_116249:330-944(+)